MRRSILIGLFILLILISCQSKEKSEKTNEEITTEAIKEVNSIIENTSDEEIIDQGIPPFPELPSEPTTREFNITGNEWNLNPPIITVNKGDKVILNFNLTGEKLEYDGFDIRSSYFSVKYTDFNKLQKIEFTADKSFTYSIYVIDTPVKRTSGRINVNS